MAHDTHEYAPPSAHLTYAERINTQWRDFLILIARVLIGLIFVTGGWAKVTAVGAFSASLERRGVPAASLLGYVGALSEFLGGIGIMFGVATRYAALLILVFTIIASLVSHRYWEFTDAAQYRQQRTQFYKNVTMMGGMLLLFITGGGRFSVDALFGRHRRD